MTENQYRKWYKKQERIYSRLAFTIIQKHFKKALQPITNDNINMANINQVLKMYVTNEMVIDMLKELYTSIMTDHYIKLTKGLEAGTLEIKRTGLPLFSRIIANLVSLVLSSFGGSKIVSIKTTLIDWVIDYLANAKAEGKGTVATANEIYKDIGKKKGLYRYQIQRIARTEVGNAVNMASLERYKNSPILLDKIWISATDERVRHFHLETDATVKALDEPFEVPVVINGIEVVELLQYPSDPNGSAGNVINCRCTIAPKTKYDANGLPMPNPNYVSDI